MNQPNIHTDDIYFWVLYFECEIQKQNSYGRETRDTRVWQGELSNPEELLGEELFSLFNGEMQAVLVKVLLKLQHIDCKTD